MRCFLQWYYLHNLKKTWKTPMEEWYFQQSCRLNKSIAQSIAYTKTSPIFTVVIRYFNIFSTTLRRKCSYSELFWSAFFPYFPAFGLNTERYRVSLCIQSKWGKMWEKCGPEQLRIWTLFTQCQVQIKLCYWKILLIWK